MRSEIYPEGIRARLDISIGSNGQNPRLHKQMEKLIVTVMGQNCQRFIKMCLDSCISQDVKLVYCDGGSTDDTLFIVDGYTGTVIKNIYDQEDKQMNGKQRNFYLNYLKENYPNDWCLVLDADEIVEDLSKVKEFINRAPPGLYSVKMRHLIGDLGHEDSTVPIHFVPHRLFKISEAGEYPLSEHPVLQPKDNKTQAGTGTDCTTIWHLAYIPNMWEIKKRYDSHCKKSEMHTPEYLKQWYHAHLFGQYPRNPIDLRDLPKELCEEFNIDKDEFYFKDRGIELKHAIMTKQWNDYFKPDNVLDLGCGRGPYLYFWKWYVNEVYGIELSEWAIRNGFVSSIIHGSCDSEKLYGKVELITAIDLLEHLDDITLNKTLNLMRQYGDKFIFSIPFIGDPNLANDSTHLQFKTKEEWIKLIESHNIKIVDTPADWLFAHQILVGIKQ